MKITKRQLRRIIREEKKRILREETGYQASVGGVDIPEMLDVAYEPIQEEMDQMQLSDLMEFKAAVMQGGFDLTKRILRDIEELIQFAREDEGM